MWSPTTTLQVVSFLDMFGAGLIVPQLWRYVSQLGCSHVLFGTMGAMYSGSQLVAGPLIGNYSDLKGRKSTLQLTVAMCGVAYILLGIANSITIFFILRSFLGFFKQTQLLTKSLAPEYINDQGSQSAVFGRLATLSGVGMSVGPMVSGHIMGAFPDYGFTIIAFTVGALFGLNTWLISTLPNVEKDSKKTQNGKVHNGVAVAPKLIDTVKNNFKESITDLKKVDWAIYWDVFLIKLLITLAIGMYFSNYPFFLKTTYDVTSTHLGYIIAFQGAVGSMSTYFIGHINKLYKKDKDAVLRSHHVFIGVTISMIGMGLAGNLYLYMLFVVPLSIAGAVGRVSAMEMILSKGKSDQRGSVIGAVGSVRSFAGVVTPILAGVISEYIGIPYVLFFAACFSAIGVVATYKIKIDYLAERTRKVD